MTSAVSRIGAALALGGAVLWTGSAGAQPLSFAPTDNSNSIFQNVMVEPDANEATENTTELPAAFRRQIVNYNGTETAGTVVVDTPNTFLYYVLGNGKAIRYGIGVGRDGFTWSGVRAVERKAEWPDWYPPAEMIERQPYLPRMMAGGPGNPLGARAMYIGGTVYRIHGTNAPNTIGKHVSSGCIRMLNADVTDLYERVKVGTRVVVRPDSRYAPSAANRTAPFDPTMNYSSTTSRSTAQNYAPSRATIY